MSVVHFYFVFSFIMFVQFTSSFKVDILNKNGALKTPDIPHVDSKYLNVEFRNRLKKQLDRFLHNSESIHNNFRSVDPANFDNGEYIIDKLKNNLSQQVNNATDDFESNKGYQDIYQDDEYINLKNNYTPLGQLKRLSKYIDANPSLRKYNILMGDKKYFKSRDIDSTENIIRKRKKASQKKRFQIINNNDARSIKKHGKHHETLSDEQKTQFESDFYSPENSDLSSYEEKKHKKKKGKKKHKEEDDGGDADDDELYLQGNVLVKLKDDDATSTGSGEDSDGRRRLPHFLPKRYHWEPKDIHKLGYFWFNGPKGRYPAPVRVD